MKHNVIHFPCNARSQFECCVYAALVKRISNQSAFFSVPDKQQRAQPSFTFAAPHTVQNYVAPIRPTFIQRMHIMHMHRKCLRVSKYTHTYIWLSHIYQVPKCVILFILLYKPLVCGEALNMVKIKLQLQLYVEREREGQCV